MAEHLDGALLWVPVRLAGLFFVVCVKFSKLGAETHGDKFQHGVGSSSS
jgi:hypothetical protein